MKKLRKDALYESFPLTQAPQYWWLSGVETTIINILCVLASLREAGINGQLKL